ncbi:hypothetical protein [Lysobacter gummosus]|uniref:hypothetical protein n=1 Tax=Lysobacter gummosus TaxID=262324 RepID=UPI00362A8B9B
MGVAGRIGWIAKTGGWWCGEAAGQIPRALAGLRIAWLRRAPAPFFKGGEFTRSVQPAM